MKLLRSLFLLLLIALPALAHGGLFDRISGDKTTFLPPDQAFGLSVVGRDEHTLLASFRVTPGYYLYRNKISFALVDGDAILGGIELPPGEIKDDPNFGTTEVYHQSFQVVIALSRLDRGQPLKLDAGYQGCSDKGLCYPPIRQTVAVDMEPAFSAAPWPPVRAETEDGRIARVLQQGDFWLVVSFFFGAGLLLAFTPCVFPMIPILSGIIVGHGHRITHRHALLLSLAYVMGMALAYAVAGVAAGMSGELISNAMQTPWVLGSFAALFVVLSLSMFGLYELQLPSVLQSRLTETSSRLHGGHFGGVFAMGALSAVIMSPCVAAPMAGALLYIGKTHDAMLGGTALFALALGMGLPLLLVGSSAGALLPRAGAWMESVKRFFGVLMLGVAIWIISPLLPVSVQMGLWAALLILSAMFLRALDSLPPNAGGWRKLWKGVGVLLLLLGAAYLVGALSGARDILRPLAGLARVQEIDTSSTPLPFVRIKSSTDLDAHIAAAGGRPVMLDFYADWCVSCKEMERFTFSDPKVRAKLKNVLLLQADVTANGNNDKALLKRFTLFGPPAILFFDGRGQEMSDFRVTGFQDASQFLTSLGAAGL